MKRTAALFVLGFVCSPLFAMKGGVYGPHGNVANAKIEVLTADDLATPRATATSDANGLFSVDPKTDGVVWVRVSAPGYAPAMMPVNAKSDDVTLNLTAAADKNGTVRSTSGPVAGARVLALDAFGDAIATYETDDKGRFTMPDPARWTRSVCVMHPSYALQCRTRGEDALPASLDFNVVPGTVVSGRAVTPAGAPVANARVEVHRYSQVPTADDGTFKIRVAPDDTDLYAMTATAAGKAKIAKTPVTITLEPGRSIGGAVRDESGHALAGARVLVHDGMRTQSATVNAKGEYSVAPLTASQYAMYVQTPAEFEVQPKDADLRKKTTARVDFTLTAAHAIHGVVRDEKKQPVAGATVIAASPEIPFIYGLTTEQQSTVSGPDGRFTMHWRAERGQLAALKPGYAAGLSDKLDAQSIRKDVVITLPAGIPVTGTVMTADKKPVADARIVVMVGSATLGTMPIASALAMGTVDEWARTDEHGAFTVRLNRGVHDFGIWKSGYAGRDLGNVDVNESTAPLHVVLDPAVEIRGRVALHRTKADNLTIYAIEQSQRSFGSATVAGDGSFVIGSLQPGTYVLRVTKLRTASQQTVTAPAKDVVIEEAETVDLRGRVIDKATGAPLTNFSVASEGENENDENGPYDHPNGEFTEAVPPGPVHLTIAAKGYLSGTLNASVTAKSDPVTIALVKGRRITGRVTSADGHPIVNASISVADTYTSSTTSDEDGDYDLDGVPTGELTVEFAKEGFRSARKVAAAGTDDQNIDVSLSSGVKVSGRVVDKSGAPVEGAHITASSEAEDAGFQSATSDKSGAFTVEGLAPAKYSFEAGKPQVGQATLKDIDVAQPQQSLVLTLGTDATGTIHGTLAGAANGGWMMAAVIATGEHGGSAHAQVGRDGKFVIDNAPAGDVTVQGMMIGMNRQSSTKAVKVTVPPGGDVDVQLTAAGDVAVRGIVRSGGQPVGGASVSFWTSGSSGGFETQTSGDGAYEVTGLGAGHYTVSVTRADGGQFSTQLDVASSTTFDINIEFTQISGRIVDDRGAAIDGAKVKVTSGAPGHLPDNDTTTDASGSFAMTVQGGTSYRVSAVKTGYVVGYADVPDGSSTPVLLRLSRGNGARVRLVDARDGSTLNGYVVIRDETGKVQIPIEGDHQADGSLLLALPEGAYRVSASANEYASITIPLTVPSSDATIPLTRGGTLIVRGDEKATELIRLVMPNGDEYVRCYCNGIAEIRLTGAVTKVDHVAAGSYRMEVVDSHGVTRQTYPVTIVENQETTVDATK